MDLRQLKSIIKEFEDSTIHKLEIIEKDFTVKMEKKGSDSVSPVSLNNNQNEKGNHSSTAQVAVLEPENNNIKVKAPLVGTFYEAPSPDGDPFVVLNQRVSKGDIIFIVEAMKVMNEISAPVSGVIKKINVEMHPWSNMAR